jgi:hypothetical protein
MKLLVALVLAFAAVDARSFIPRKVFDETYFDKDKYESFVGKNKEFNFETNDVDTFTKPDYYKYFFPGGDSFTKKPFYPFNANYDGDYKKPVDTFYDTNKYDLDTFVKYFTSSPVLGQLTKYFPLNKDSTYNYFYYPVPKEVVELTKTSKDLKETLQTLVKYYYNLPEDVKATVSQKYDFDNVVKFLLQVYYDIPSVANGLTSYYDIPSAVIAELKTQYDLRKVIYNIVTKYYEFGQFERDYYTKRYFDVKAIATTLVKVYYGIPKYEFDVEKYYYDSEYTRKFVEGIVSGKYEGIVDSVAELLERRSRLTETEKEFYDQFFNVDEYFKFIVKGYYYAYTEATKTPFATSDYFKKGFYDLVTKIFKYKKDFYGGNFDFVNFDEFYPLEYYMNVLFKGYYGKNTNDVVPFGNYNGRGYFPYNKEYSPYNKEYFQYNKEYTPYNKEYSPYYNFFKYFYGKYDKTPKEFDSFNGGSYYPFNAQYPKNFYEFAMYFYYKYPEQFKYAVSDYKNFEKVFGDYYAKEDGPKYYDFVKKFYEYYSGKYDTTYDFDFSKKSFETPSSYGKYDYDFFKKIASDYYKYKKGGDFYNYGNDETFGSNYGYGYPFYPKAGYNFEKFFGGYGKDTTKAYFPFNFDKEYTPKTYTPFTFDKEYTPKTYTPFTYNKETNYPFFKYPTTDKYFFEKYFANKDF